MALRDAYSAVRRAVATVGGPLIRFGDSDWWTLTVLGVMLAGVDVPELAGRGTFEIDYQRRIREQAAPAMADPRIRPVLDALKSTYNGGKPDVLVGPLRAGSADLGKLIKSAPFGTVQSIVADKLPIPVLSAAELAPLPVQPLVILPPPVAAAPPPAPIVPPVVAAPAQVKIRPLKPPPSVAPEFGTAPAFEAQIAASVPPPPVATVPADGEDDPIAKAQALNFLQKEGIPLGPAPDLATVEIPDLSLRQQGITPPALADANRDLEQRITQRPDATIATETLPQILDQVQGALQANVERQGITGFAVGYWDDAQREYQRLRVEADHGRDTIKKRDAARSLLASLGQALPSSAPGSAYQPDSGDAAALQRTYGDEFQAQAVQDLQWIAEKGRAAADVAGEKVDKLSDGLKIAGVGALVALTITAVIVVAK